MKRRSFLIGSFGLLIARGNFYAAPSKVRRSTLGRIVSPYTSAVEKIKTHGVMTLDLDRREMKTIQTSFPIHKVSIGKKKSGLGYGIGSYSNHIAKIDLNRAKLMVTAELDQRFSYSGHSIVSKTGDIYASISEGESPNRRTGLVRIHPDTLKVEEEFIFPKLPGLTKVHDIQKFSPDGNILVCTGGSYLLQFNLKSKSIQRTDKIEFDLPDAILNHFAFSSKGDFGIQSNVFDQGTGNNTGKARAGAPVLFNGQSRKFRILRQTGELSKRLNEDLFGLCLNSDASILCIASLWDHYLSFWNMKTGHFIKGLDLRQPTGVTLSSDGKHFLVTTTAGLKSFNSLTLEPGLIAPEFTNDFAKIFGLKMNESRLFHSTAYI